ncbi:MAG: hypothetical protein N2749_03915 [Clostridia bacterium]|nr:hypothetical protein [Clostridia bacterium]
MNKKGISFIVLMITIVVALILISVTVISTKNSIDNATITKMAESIKQVEDASEAYYISNGKFPTSDENSEPLTKNQVIGLVADNVESEFLSEVDQNNDGSVNEYYKIDLSKINVQSTSYGRGTDGQDDVFVIAYPSMNVYYLKGFYAKSTVYFSISPKISNIVKVDQNLGIPDGSQTEVISSSGINVTKQKDWTSKMSLIVKTTLDSNETMYISISDGVQKQMITSSGEYEKSFNVTDLFAPNSILTDTATFAITDILENKKYMDIIKKKDSSDIGKVRIDLTKLDLTHPDVTNILTSSYTNMNVVTFDIADNASGVNQIRYDYLTRIDDNGTEQNYYKDISSFDIEYMKQKSKVLKNIESNTVSINIPKNVNQVSIAVFDKAGNYILQGVRVQPIINISNIINSATKEKFNSTTNVYSTRGVSQIKSSYSLDGLTYINEQIISVNSDSLTTSRQINYDNVNASKIYYKIEVTDNNSTVALRKIETKIFVINENLSDYEVSNTPVLVSGLTAKKWNTTTSAWDTVASPSTDTSWYDYKNKVWANAQSADGSMWVWIPRYIYKISSLWHTNSSQGGVVDVQFSQGTNDNWNSSIISSIDVGTSSNASNNKWTSHPAFKFGSVELTGIWVAKFEVSGTVDSLDIKPGVSSLRNLSVSQMFTASRNMETNNKYGWGTTGQGIDTHLMKNTEWGAVSYLAQSKYGKNAEVWINPNSNYLTGNAGTTVSASSTITTYAYTDVTNGINASTTGNIYGIYDMSGGAWECTAAYINNQNANLNNNGSNLVNADVKYKDIYDKGTTDDYTNNYVGTINKKGDAIYETSQDGSASDSAWYLDQTTIPYTNTPFFIRGGGYDLTSASGIFTFGASSGAAFNYLSFRPVLVVGETL